MNKSDIIKELHTLVDQKLQSAEKAIISATESRDSDGKSSMGDKYETNRAMMQIEIGNQEKKKAQLLHLKADLNRINLDRTNNKVEFGSMVHTSQGVYFLGIGIGMIKVLQQTIFAISVSAPIAQAMMGLKLGDRFNFNGKTQEILSLS